MMGNSLCLAGNLLNPGKKSPLNAGCYALDVSRLRSVEDFGDDAGTYRSTTLSDRKTQALFHRNRRNQRRHKIDVVTRHHHLNTLRQLNRARYIRRTEVKLRTVTLEKRRMTTTLVLRQNINLCLKL